MTDDTIQAYRAKLEGEFEVTWAEPIAGIPREDLAAVNALRLLRAIRNKVSWSIEPVVAGYNVTLYIEEGEMCEVEDADLERAALEVVLFWKDLL